MATATKKRQNQKIDLAESLRKADGFFSPIQVLNEEGEIVRPDIAEDISDDQLVDLMKRLVFGRVYDQRVIALNRQGQLGNYAPGGGQEASQLASEYALEKNDYLLPTYRDLTPLIAHGVPMYKVFLWYKGHMTGNDYPSDLHALPAQVIIGSQDIQAAGIGLGLKKNGKPNVVMAYIGDGGTSQGDFYEGINFAGAFGAPVLFLVQDNLYAISVPRSFQTRSHTLAQKALAAGIPGVQVDGMDPLAMYAVTKAARDYAVAGNGPVVIESLTFRYGPHTMSDDPTRYRPQELVDEWKKRDSLIRMRKVLESKGLWDQQQEDAYIDSVKKDIKDALAKANAEPVQKVSQFLKNMYEVPPQNIAEQIAQYESKESN